MHAAKINPTLSSIWTNTNKLGEKALHTLIDVIDGKQVSGQHMPVKFIMRESFGDKKIDRNTQTKDHSSLINTYVDSVFYNCRYEESESASDSIKKFELLLNKLFLLTTEEYSIFVYSEITNCAEHIHLENADVDNLLVVYDELYNYICTVKPEKKDEILQLFDTIYRKTIRTMNHQFGHIQDKQENDNYLFKLFVSNTMQFENGTDESYTKLFSDVESRGLFYIII